MNCLVESGSLGLLPKLGDKLPPRLNIDGKPIANKYYEGKMKRTLKRGLKDLKPLGRKVWELAVAVHDFTKGMLRGSSTARMLTRRKVLCRPKVGWGPGALKAGCFWVASDACLGLRGFCDPAVTASIHPS